MAAVLFVLFLVVPVLELGVLIAVGRRLGLPETLGLMILVSVAGAVMAKRQGLRAWRAVQERLAQGEMPGAEVIDGLLVLIGAALLLTPGFLTDAVGILLLVPFVRAGLRGVVRRRFERRLRVVTVAGDAVRARRDRVVDADARESQSGPEDGVGPKELGP